MILLKKLEFDLDVISKNYFPGKQGARKEIDIRLKKFRSPIPINIPLTLILNKKRKRISINEKPYELK